MLYKSLLQPSHLHGNASFFPWPLWQYINHTTWPKWQYINGTMLLPLWHSMEIYITMAATLLPATGTSFQSDPHCSVYSKPEGHQDQGPIAPTVGDQLSRWMDVAPGSPKEIQGHECHQSQADQEGQGPDQEGQGDNQAQATQNGHEVKPNSNSEAMGTTLLVERKKVSVCSFPLPWWQCITFHFFLLMQCYHGNSLLTIMAINFLRASMAIHLVSMVSCPFASWQCTSKFNQWALWHSILVLWSICQYGIQKVNNIFNYNYFHFF